jgi:very-short-patch-repair endonuclease
MKQYRFDFFISAYKTLIECDGEQHFMNSSKFYSTHVRGKNFEEQQESDRIKTQYAVDNGYTILRIAYTELSRVDQILKEFVDKQLWKTSEKVHLYPIELYTWLGHKESTIESLKAENKFLKAENESLKLQLEELLKRQNEKPNIIEHV